MIFGKIDICTPLPTVYICVVWDHSQANEENIRNTINWSKAFKNLPVDGKVEHLNETYLEIPVQIKKCDYGQPPY